MPPAGPAMILHMGAGFMAMREKTEPLVQIKFICLHLNQFNSHLALFSYLLQASFVPLTNELLFQNRLFLLNLFWELILLFYNTSLYILLITHILTLIIIYLIISSWSHSSLFSL